MYLLSTRTLCASPVLPLLFYSYLLQTRSWRSARHLSAGSECPQSRPRNGSLTPRTQRFAPIGPVGPGQRSCSARLPASPERRFSPGPAPSWKSRSEEHTSELQSRGHLVCRLLLEKKNTRHAS